MNIKTALLAVLVAAFAYFVIVVPRIEDTEGTLVPRAAQDNKP
jgi:hypothetical protein